MKRPLLQVRNLRGGYGEKDIFSQVYFSLSSGEVIGLIGPNGSGKSTLIRHIIGVMKPREGQVFLSGKPLEKLGARERGQSLAYVPQDMDPGFDHALGELVALGRYPHRGQGSRGPHQDRESILRALRYVGLEDRLESPFRELSGGEKQRGLFARALAQEAPLLVLDEPSSSLDMGQEHQLFSMLRELAVEGRGILVAVHNLNVAAEYCHRILLLDPGRGLLQGPPEEILTQENLSRVFRTEIRLGRNDHTGSLLVLHGKAPGRKSLPTVHLIGGAGSAMNLTRHLIRLGYTLTGGVAHEGDSDALLWQSLGVEFAREQPFSPISAAALEKARILMNRADLTVLCDFPLGAGNGGNLDLAEEAPRLVVLKGRRSCFVPALEARLKALLAGASVRILEESDLVKEWEWESGRS